MRKLTYCQAINEASHQLMEDDERVFIMGQGINSPWFVGETTKGLYERFGQSRVMDLPVSENATTGVAAGAALAGMRPIILHPRMDFMFLAFDQIINHAAKMSYMFGGRINCPVVIRGIVNRGGEQAAQHSQSSHPMLMNVPGLKIVMPATPYDAKGLLIAAVRDGNPVIYIDDRWLYRLEGEVPEEIYETTIGKGVVARQGSDVTVAALSYLVQEANIAAQKLENEGIDVEVVNLRSAKPLDINIVLKSVGKTRRLIIAEGGNSICSTASEVSALVAENNVFRKLKSPIKRVTLPDAPAPASSTLEKAYYPQSGSIISAVHEVLGE